MKKLLSSITILLLFACGNKVDTDKPFVARVENSVLKIEDANRIKTAVTNENFSQSDVVAEWVDRELLYLASIKAGLGNDETLKHAVVNFQKDLLGKTFLDKYVASKISIKNNDIKTYYDKHRNSFRYKRNGAKILHFLVLEDSTATFIANALENPNISINRKELMANYNVDVSVVEEGSLIEELNFAIFNTDRNEAIFGPIKTVNGHHVVEVLDRFKSGEQIDINEAYDEIYQRLFNQKKALESVQLVDSLRNSYSVKINLENIK